MDNQLPKYTVAFGLSFAVASVLNAMLVVAKEKSHVIQGWMQKATGHHWITHCFIIVAVFVFFGWLFARANHGEGIKMSASSLIKMVIAGAAAGYVVIAGFYLIAG